MWDTEMFLIRHQQLSDFRCFTKRDSKASTWSSDALDTKINWCTFRYKDQWLNYMLPLETPTFSTEFLATALTPNPKVFAPTSKMTAVIDSVNSPPHIHNLHGVGHRPGNSLTTKYEPCRHIPHLTPLEFIVIIKSYFCPSVCGDLECQS